MLNTLILYPNQINPNFTNIQNPNKTNLKNQSTKPNLLSPASN